jgi:hypothetical protein
MRQVDNVWREPSRLCKAIDGYLVKGVKLLCLSVNLCLNDFSLWNFDTHFVIEKNTIVLIYENQLAQEAEIAAWLKTIF